MRKSDSSDSTATYSSDSISRPSPLQVFNMTISDIFVRQTTYATLAAQFALDNEYRDETFMPSVITSESCSPRGNSASRRSPKGVSRKGESAGCSHQAASPYVQPARRQFSSRQRDTSKGCPATPPSPKGFRCPSAMLSRRCRGA
ncbi:hypothetical protein GE21DRAFT_1342477 [Neurospora crassa]|nr:hypothetical protein GE21DRAFT_1342477 [Neurospora crassa]